MNYELMSDFEINKVVATLKGLDISGATVDNNKMYDYVKDYCNNPADAWPIIVENEISIVFMPDEWECHALINNDEAFNTTNKNPLRAAMIVFLMMSES